MKPRMTGGSASEPEFYKNLRVTVHGQPLGSANSLADQLRIWSEIDLPMVTGMGPCAERTEYGSLQHFVLDSIQIQGMVYTHKQNSTMGARKIYEAEQI